MEKKILKIIEKGWENPSSEEQAEAVCKAIMLFIKEDESGSRVDILINLKELILSYCK